MNDLHRAYLSLGSNIQPEINLIKAVELLRKHGDVKEVSNVWESKSVGFDGPNFLNACLLFLSGLQPVDLKERIIRPIEEKLGRVRFADKNAPRTIDIDIVLFDEKPLNTDFWDYAYVSVPLAELIPDFIHPNRHENLFRVSEKLQEQIWIVKRDKVKLDLMQN